MMYISRTFRESFTEGRNNEEASDVVKGTSKRIIVVKTPDQKIFDEAIFIVKEEYMRSPGVTKDKLLNEAYRAADSYLGSHGQRAKTPLGLVIAASSLCGSGLAFAALKLFGL